MENRVLASTAIPRKDSSKVSPPTTTESAVLASHTKPEESTALATPPIPADQIELAAPPIPMEEVALAMQSVTVTSEHRAPASPRPTFETIDDASLLRDLKSLVGRSNTITAHLLAHLAEVDARRAYREAACPSLYKYCVYELRMSEDEAQRRVQAARAVRHFPVLLDMLADASIHLTGILLLAPHLTVDNHDEVLARARYRTKREIQRLVAEIAPRPDVDPKLEPLRRPGGPLGSLRSPSWAEYTAALAGAVRQLAPSNDQGGAPTAPDAEPAPIPAPPPPDATLHPSREGPFPVVEPLSRGRYRVEITVDQSYVDLLEEARDLLAHQIPNRDLVAVHEKAMQTLVKALRKRRRADTTRAGAANRAGAADTDGAVSNTSASRHVPAALRRAVWERDQGRCTYVDARGCRCPETGGLEIHHQKAFAKGGATTLENLALRCRPHNDLAAEQDFGRKRMDRKKKRAPPR